jgi:hypothetical protein
MNLRKLFVFTILAVSTTSALADSITYSGVKNIVLNGVAGSNQTLNIQLLGIASPSDTVQLIISDFPGDGDPYGGVFEETPGISDVVPAFGTYPVADALHKGDPYPTKASGGSGSIILYGFDYPTLTGDFYYPLLSGTSNLTGWIQLLFTNTGSPNESITVVDWAVTTDPAPLSMGEGQTTVTPEPASWLLMGSAAAAGLLARLRYFRGMRFGSKD